MSGLVEVPFPFVREQAQVLGEDGFEDVISWRPGTEIVPTGPNGEDSEYEADGVGVMVIEEVSRHKPGRYPERVFYVRQWIDPDGNQFGKTGLRMTTAAVFKRLCSGYMHEYRLREECGEAR